MCVYNHTIYLCCTQPAHHEDGCVGFVGLCRGCRVAHGCSGACAGMSGTCRGHVTRVQDDKLCRGRMRTSNTCTAATVPYQPIAVLQCVCNMAWYNIMVNGYMTDRQHGRETSSVTRIGMVVAALRPTRE